MSGKRQATTNLNHDNWDQEEEPEERGTFKTAPPEELKTRVIKKPTRRKAGVGGSDADETAPNTSSSVFSGFSGFGKPASSTSGSGGTGTGTASPFAFLSNLKAPDSATASKSSPNFNASSSSENADNKSTIPAKMFAFEAKPVSESTSNALTNSTKSSGSSIFGVGSAAAVSLPTKPMFNSTVPIDKSSSTVCSSSSSTSTSSEYRATVAELNMSVMKFLQERMDKNPYCILTPVFESYDRLLKGLQSDEALKTNAEIKISKSGVDATKTSTPTSFSTPTTKSFSFGKPNNAIESGSALPSTTLGKKPNCTVTSGGTATIAAPPKFSFGTSGSTAITSSSTKPEATASALPSSTFSFGIKPPPSDAPAKTSFFSFGNKGTADKVTDAAASTTTPTKTNGFSFGLKSDDKPNTSVFAGFGKAASGASGFTFTSPPTNFSFGNVKPPTAAAIEAAATEAAEDDDDTPPKVEFNKVVEDDATFSKRCKVFVKKDKDFTDRGVGTLYLKPVKDTEKTQMLVRADTNLGNILINLILSKGLPCQRMGKNNVMMVCIPTPEESKSMSILLRVKSGEEADELLEQIKTHSV